MSDETFVELIRSNYKRTQEDISKAAQNVGRNPDEIKLLVVTKKQPLPVILAALAAGVGLFGENYPEEAVSKKQALVIESKVEWHMIGHVQSRKARLVAEHFALLHSLDSLKLARRLDRFCAEVGRRLPVLLEFNVGGEASKFGWQVADKTQWDSFLPDIDEILALENLEVQGLMTMPPFFQDAELARPYFRRLRELRDHFSLQYPHVEWEQLSMGTSGDFRVAVEEGATFVRIGQAILGARPL